MDGFIALCAGAFVGFITVFTVAWMTVFPTIGLLWCIGWLS